MTQPENDIWISASEIGAAHYCPYSVFLKHQGVQVTATSTYRGRLLHSKEEIYAAADKRCFVASYA